MKGNQIFYHFLNAVAPEEKKKFKSTNNGYETYTPISKAGVKVSYNENSNSIYLTKIEKEYVGGMYEDIQRTYTYEVQEFEDRLKFNPR